MKKCLLLLGLFVVTTLTMTAQSETMSQYTNGKKYEGWTGLRLSYNPINLQGTETYGEIMNGGTLALVKGFPVSCVYPIFIETGVGLTYAGDSGKYNELNARLDCLTLHIPINLGIKHYLSDSFSIFPYVGIAFRGNLMANLRIKHAHNGENKHTTYGLFDDDDFGGNTWNRINIGWHIGLGMDCNKFHMGVSYGSNFNDFADGLNASTLSVTLGVNF